MKTLIKTSEPTPIDYACVIYYHDPLIKVDK
ncbi:hypothetical protein AQUSIP_01920 [Aquicella siphonis]|uniref:Uncharacterized protein n=1 Tax=Aquicella siphonis TaxID=254247 RepID=A0A5E4PEL2_9COXI|nr:hypothetical protein AQUSIP_01920 [Aquicella siphonis]